MHIEVNKNKENFVIILKCNIVICKYLCSISNDNAEVCHTTSILGTYKTCMLGIINTTAVYVKFIICA